MPTIDEPANARSRRTRQALLVATREILQEDGFEALTMSAVADRAGVTRRAVYLHFDSRAALVSNLFEHVAEVEDLTGSARPVEQAPDGPAALQAWAEHLADYHPRVMAVDRAIQQVETTDTNAANHRATVSQAQLRLCRQVTNRLDDEGRLADGWTPDSATDLLYGLIATDLIDRLLNHRGWTQQQLGDRLARMLQATLVADTND